MLEHKPTCVIHGDDWRSGDQEKSRQVVLGTIKHWGGELIEVPYTKGYSSSGLKQKMGDAGR